MPQQAFRGVAVTTYIKHYVNVMICRSEYAPKLSGWYKNFEYSGGQIINLIIINKDENDHYRMQIIKYEYG